MKIIPYHSVLIDGVHCEAGAVAEVRDATALAMIQQGFARRAPVVESAAVAPAVEAASTAAKAVRRKV